MKYDWLVKAIEDVSPKPKAKPTLREGATFREILYFHMAREFEVPDAPMVFIRRSRP